MTVWKWMIKITYYLIVVSLILAILGTSYQVIQEFADNRAYPPPGELVDIGDSNLHYQLLGEGEPTVILEAGFGGSSIDWSLVQPEIAKFTRVFSYDRAGYGWSEEIVGTRSAWEVVDDLNTLLEKQHIDPPYLLVGHSFGALYMQLFLMQYPEKVMGMVLVDPPFGEQVESLLQQLQEVDPADLRTIEMMSEMGLFRLFMSQNRMVPQTFSDNTKNIWLAKHATVKHIRTMLNELQSLPLLSKELQPIESVVENRPLIIISAGKPMDIDPLGLAEEWSTYADEHYMNRMESHKELVSQIPNSKHITAEKSNHMIPWYQADLIVDEVKDMVEGMRYRDKENLEDFSSFGS